MLWEDFAAANSQSLWRLRLNIRHFRPCSYQQSTTMLDEILCNTPTDFVFFNLIIMTSQWLNLYDGQKGALYNIWIQESFISEISLHQKSCLHTQKCINKSSLALIATLLSHSLKRIIWQQTESTGNVAHTWSKFLDIAVEN